MSVRVVVVKGGEARAISFHEMRRARRRFRESSLKCIRVTSRRTRDGHVWSFYVVWHPSATSHISPLSGNTDTYATKAQHD